MKYSTRLIFGILSLFLLISGCGPDKEERQRREQAREDSLEQVRRQAFEQQRRDSLEKAQLRQQQPSPTHTRSDITFSDDGPLAVQVASWRSEYKAKQTAEKWKQRGFSNTQVVRYGDTQRGDIWFRVRLGRVESRETAEAIQQNIREQYQADSWIATVD